MVTKRKATALEVLTNVMQQLVLLLLVGIKALRWRQGRTVVALGELTREGGREASSGGTAPQ